MKPDDAQAKDQPRQDAAVAHDVAGIAPAGPLDGDWAQRERAGKVKPLPDDDSDLDDVYGDPSTVKDEGPLKSFGKAVSAPVRDAAGEDPAGRPKPKAP